MPVTDDMVAAVRAYLQADTDEFDRLNAVINDSNRMDVAYKAMIIATFAVAVRRKFSERSSRDEVIEYVANVRSRGPKLPEVLDPNASEQMITSVFTDESIRDIDARTKMMIWTHFSAAIVSDAGLKGEELEAFLADAREFANELLN